MTTINEQQSTITSGECPTCGCTCGDTNSLALRTQRPSENEAWAEFWTKIASIWVSLPPQVQAEYAGDTRA